MYLYYCLKREKRASEQLLRQALAEYLKVKEPAISPDKAFQTVIAKAEFGKPYLPEFMHIRFSVSHSGDCWGCLMSSTNVGLDIESVKNGQFVKITERFFSDDEIDFIKSSHNSQTLIDNFYFIWTRKEAYLKLTGRGLGAGLSNFSVLSGLEDVEYQSINIGDGLVTAYCYYKNEHVGDLTLFPLQSD